MKMKIRLVLLVTLLFVSINLTQAQNMKLGEVLIVSTPTFKSDVEPKAYETLTVDVVGPAWKERVPGHAHYLCKADRGDRNGEYLSVWMVDTAERRRASVPAEGDAPFSDDVLQKVEAVSNRVAAYVEREGAYTEYQLIEADQLGELPNIDLLGIHYYQVKSGREHAFEQFVIDTLHPALADHIEGMPLFYFKAVRGAQTGSYILLFAIETLADRERYWPTGEPETDAVREAFRPMKDIANELRDYLVDGSYLTAEGAAAAIFESLEWTDFAYVQATR